jgi:hypothetical protein
MIVSLCSLSYTIPPPSLCARVHACAWVCVGACARVRAWFFPSMLIFKWSFFSFRPMIFHDKLLTVLEPAHYELSESLRDCRSVKMVFIFCVHTVYSW